MNPVNPVSIGPLPRGYGLPRSPAGPAAPPVPEAAAPSPAPESAVSTGTAAPEPGSETATRPIPETLTYRADGRPGGSVPVPTGLRLDVRG